MPFDQPSATSSYSMLQAETALCIWEELDWRTNLTNPKRCAELIRWREEYGSYALRHAALSLAGDIEALYDALPAEDWDGLAFDWEIVPAVLDWVIWTGDRPFLLLAPGLPTAMFLCKGIRRRFEAA